MSWLFSTLTLIGLGSLILPLGLSEIGDWLGPLFGPAFRPELILVFLLLGPPLSYTPLLMTWAVAGLVGGFFARGVKRSMVAGTLSTTTIILLIVANAFIIFTGLGGLVNGFSGLNIPPPPPGVGIADVLNAPLVSQGIGALASGGLNPVGILRSLVANFIVNIAIHAGSFIISGLIFSKLLGRRHSKPSPAVQSQIGPQPTLPSAPVVAVFSLVVLLLLSAVTMAPAGVVQAGPSNGGVSGEQLALNLQSDGSLRMTYSTNITALPGVPSDYSRAEFQGLVGGFLFAFNGSVDLGQGGSGGSGGSFSFLVPLLPPNGFLAAYAVPDQSTGKARADVLASEFGQGFGVTLTPTVSMMLPSFGGQQVPGGKIYLGIYSGNGQPGKIGATVLGLVDGTGVGTILTPQKLFQGQFGVQAGYVNFNVQNATGTPMFVPAVQMSSNLTPLANYYGHGNFTLGLRQTFGAQGTIGPSGVARTTSLQLAFPANSTVIAYRPTNATLNAPQGQLSYSMNATSMPISDMYVNFTGTFPQRIAISRQLSPQPPVSSGTTVRDTITVTNQGNQTIHGVLVSEKKLFQTYPTLQLLSPSQNVSLGDIPPQTSANATFQFRVGSDGFYSLPPIQLSYTDQGQAVSKASTPAYLQSSFNLGLYLQELVRGTAPYSYLFLLLLVLPPVLQLPKLFHRSHPRGAYAPVPVAVGSGPAPSPTP